MSKTVEEKDLVWAKMRGHPHWPAKVMKPPKGTRPTAHKLFIFFYGTHEHAWVSESELFPYEKFCDKFKKPSNRKGFMEGIKELEEELAKIRKRGAGKKVTSPSQKSSGEISPRKDPSLTIQHPSASGESANSDTVITDRDTNKGQNTSVTVNQEDSKKGGIGDQTASADVFFVSQEDSSRECSQKAPILLRKRRALRSLSQEAVKKTRNDDPGSLPLGGSDSHLSPSGKGSSTSRVTRSLTPHHYIAQQQQVHVHVGGVEPLKASDTVKQSVPEDITESGSDVPNLLVPPMQKEGETKAVNDTEASAGGEQMQTSSVTPEQTSSEDGLAYFLSMGEEEKTAPSRDTHEPDRDSEPSPTKVVHDEKKAKQEDQSEEMDCTGQAEAKQSPKATHGEDKKTAEQEQSVVETPISTSGSQGKAVKPSKLETAKPTTCKGSAEVTSPRRYSTRRQGVAQGSTVEKLTQSYTARLEQALGSPDAQKKKLPTLQSPKRTPKVAKAPPKATAKSVGGRNSKRSRGGARGKVDREGGGEEGKAEMEGGGGDDESAIGGAGSKAVSAPSTPQVGMGKRGENVEGKQEVKGESKPEPGRRKSARLSSKIQQASTPSGDQRKTVAGKKQKEMQSTGKKRSRPTSDSSVEDGNEELKIKIETVDQEMAVMEGEPDLQSEAEDNSTTPVVKKQSKGGRKSQAGATASEEKTVKQSKASKAQAPSSGGRGLRSRQRGVAGSKDKSLPKKMKLEQSGESLTSESQQQSSVETNEEEQPQQMSGENTHVEDSSDNKRVLRKRKQTSNAANAESSSKCGATGKNNASESANLESSSKSTPTRQSKRLKVASNDDKSESETVDSTTMPTTDESGKKCEELIIRVPTSVTKVNVESESLASGESINEATSDKPEMTAKPNEKEPASLKSTAKGDVDINGGQTGGQEAPPTTGQPNDQSSSKADPQPSSSNVQSSSSIGGDEGNKKTDEKDKVELPKKIDSSDLPPMIKIRAGMSTVEVLQAYNYNIKASLVINAPNVTKALTTLHDLKELQFSAADLEKVPDLVYTVRKLKHYHASSKVVRRAEEVYGKLKGLYMYPKLVPRPLKKKAVGGAGIRKRPPTMAEYLNRQTKQQKPSQLSKAQSHSKSKSSTSSTLVTSNLAKSQTPPPVASPSAPPTALPPEAGGITDVISKKPTSDEIKAAHAPVVPQLTDKEIEKVSKDKEQPNQQLAEEMDNSPSQSAVISPTSTTSSIDVQPISSLSNIPTCDSVQASNNNSTVTDTEQGSIPPLQTGGALDSGHVVSTETKESSVPLQTGDNSVATDVSCPGVSERSENVLEKEAESQEANPLQTSGHNLAAGASCPGGSEVGREEKSQEANPLQTSSHSLAADASCPGVSEAGREEKSQETNPLQTSGHSLAADASCPGGSEAEREEKSQEANPLQTSGHSLAADASCPGGSEAEREEKSQEANPLQTSGHSLAADASCPGGSEAEREEKSQEANPLQTSSHSLAADASCPGGSEAEREEKSQEANPLQTSGHSLAADASCPGGSEAEREEKSQEANPLQTSGHSLAADASCPGISEAEREKKSQEANPLQTSGHSLAADASCPGGSEAGREEKSQEAKQDQDKDQIVPSS